MEDADRDYRPGLAQRQIAVKQAGGSGWLGAVFLQRPAHTCKALGQVLSLMVLLLPLVFTEAMPASRDCALAYIWLLPMIWWLAALRLK